jgi:hypothetical protein
MAGFRMYRGENKVWEITVYQDGVVLDLSGASLFFEVRRFYPTSETVTEAGALIDKSVGDGITITNAAGGIFELEVISADTDQLTPGNYYYGIEYIPAGGTEARVIKQGRFRILADVVRGV